jgi:hypothetical protein
MLIYSSLFSPVKETSVDIFVTTKSRVMCQHILLSAFYNLSDNAFFTHWKSEQKAHYIANKSIYIARAVSPVT